MCRLDMSLIAKMGVREKSCGAALGNIGILPGTPHGVGFARKPPTYLKAGDSVTIEIEKIGPLTNPVVEEAVG